ncbi:MAG: hemolysin family protein [Gemmatimonadota bacterium]|jgi:putative hemolysin
MLALILGFAIALVLSALFSIAELALFSLGVSRIHTLLDAGFRGSEALVQARSQPGRLFVFLRLGNTTCDVAAAGLGVLVGLRLLGGAGVLIAVLVTGLLVLLIGELLPRAVAVHYNVRIALAVAPIFLLLVRLFRPILALLDWAPTATPETAVNGGAEDEIRQLTELGESEGVIEEHERQLIEGAFRLDETQVWDIMTPRVDIFAWPDSLRLAEIATQFGTVPYSRVPVYGESIDQVTGVLYLRDAYQALINGQRDIPLRDLARQPLIVPGSLNLTRLLRDFQQRRIHLALVVDEYGGTDGLVTLEDVIEELVGEIVDETDVAEETITRVSRNEILAEGDTDLREINHIFNTSFPLLEHRSLNGFLLEELGHVPAVGETLETSGIRIEVTDASETQVLRARLFRYSPPTEPMGWPTSDRPDSDASSETHSRETDVP